MVTAEIRFGSSGVMEVNVERLVAVHTQRRTKQIFALAKMSDEIYGTNAVKVISDEVKAQILETDKEAERTFNEYQAEIDALPFGSLPALPEQKLILDKIRTKFNRRIKTLAARKKKLLKYQQIIEELQGWRRAKRQ